MSKLKKRCWAPECCAKTLNIHEMHYFSAPKDNGNLSLWQSVFPQKPSLMGHHVLCHLHFKEEDILKDFVHVINGQTERFPRKKWSLVPGAIPIPKHGNVTPDKIERSYLTNLPVVTESSEAELMHKQRLSYSTYARKSYQMAQNSAPISSTEPQVSKEDNTCADLLPLQFLEMTWTTCNSPLDTTFAETEVISQPCKRKSTRDNYLENLKEEKEANGSTSTIICKREPDLPTEESNSVPVGHSNPTTGSLPDVSNPKSTYREPKCVMKSRLDRSCCTSLKTKVRYLRRRLRAKNTQISNLKSSIKTFRAELDEVNNEKTNYKELPAKQKLLIREALQKVQAKTPTRHRFSKEWLMDALTLKLKSPVVYEYLRTNEFMPLPCSSTLNRSIRKTDAAFGVDETENESTEIVENDEMQISPGLPFDQ